MSTEPRAPAPQSNEPLWRFTWTVVAVVVFLVLGLILLTRLTGMWG